MRRIVATAVIGLLAITGLAVSPASAATPTQPKVVIIVGPVASATASYKSDADAAYLEALKYTPNVVRVYTPNATWSAAKAALQGASVVIYLGHGNGFRARTGRIRGPTRRTAWGSTRRRAATTPRPSTTASSTSPAT